ncbi:MAG: nucleotidyltransferase family protein [Acidobacteria bacterium]|nr:nucleotidyltransferase family protein [Acidobacteriota bacterium]
MPDSRVTAVVPAAGAARRFGGRKLLADINGEPLLQHTLRALLDGGVSRVVLVVAPGHGLGAVPLARDGRVRLSINPDPERGMFSSILEGLARVDPGHAALVLPADMPFVRAETVAAVIAAYAKAGRALVAAYRGKRGHPLIVPPDVWAEVIDQPVDMNLKTALVQAGVALSEAPVDDPGVVRDVDEKRDLL